MSIVFLSPRKCHKWTKTISTVYYINIDQSGNIVEFIEFFGIQWNLLISNIALLATNLQVPGEDFVLILFPY